MGKDNGNENGKGDQVAADQNGPTAEVRAQQARDGRESDGNAAAEVRTGASDRKDATGEKAAVSEDGPTAAEFEDYVVNELNPIAEKLGYRKIVLETVPREECWPAWYYDAQTKEGVICKDESEVPEGYVRNPHTNAE